MSAPTEHTANEEIVGPWIQYLQPESVNQHLSALNEYQCVSAGGLAINQFSRQTSSKELSTVTLGWQSGVKGDGLLFRMFGSLHWCQRERTRSCPTVPPPFQAGEGSAREGRHRSLLSRTRSVLSTHNLPTLLCPAPLVRRCCQLFSLPRPYKPLRHISSRLPRGMRRIRDLTHFRESSFIFSGGESK